MTVVGLPSVQGRWRALAALVAAAIVMALFPLGLAQAEDRNGMTVLTATGNVGAALAWSTHAHDQANNAVIGRSDLPPDNLASGLLQGVLDAPLLLTPPSALNADVKAELERLEVRTVHILGGLSAISAAVESELRAEGYAVRRYSGPSRLETAQEIAEAHAGAATTALLARAFGNSADPTSAWADALAGGAWAADDGVPVLFTQTETLTASTRDYLQSSRIRNISILGGTGAVSPAVETELKAMGITVERVSGATRFATAVEIAKERGFDTAGDTDVTSIVLTDGQNAEGWAPGFAAAGFAADKPVVLSNAGALPAETDAWFAGAQASDKLIVAPYVTEAAATAAADKMGLLKQADVTLDSTSFPQGGNITGKVTPMEDVKSVAISGPCVTAGAVTPNESTGAFSVPVSQTFEPGSCALTITVTYDDNATTTHPFTITVTAPPPTPAVLNGPELQMVSVFNQTDDYVVLKYTFDEGVAFVSGATNNFRVIGYDGTSYTPDVHGDFGAPVRDDQADEKSILASFRKEEFLRSTTATIWAGGVSRRGQATYLNPEGSRSLQNVVFPKGQTVLPDLVSITDLRTVDQDTTTEVADYVVNATFNFDTAVDTLALAEDKFWLMESDGDWRQGYEIVSGNGTANITVEFGSDDNGGTFGATQSNADNFRTSVGRGRVDTGAVEDAWEQDNIAQSANVGSPAFTIPVLTSVTLLPSTDQVQFHFSVPVDNPAAANAAKFFIYDHMGVREDGTGDPAVVANTNSKSIVVTFPDGAIDGQTALAGTDEAAVATATPESAAFQTVGIEEHPFTAGSTLAPDLQRVIRTSSSTNDPFGGSEVTSYTVTYRFDRDVEELTTALTTDLGLKLYSSEGEATEFNTDDGACARGDTTATKKDIICTVAKADDEDLFNAIRDAVLFAVEEAAITADAPDSDAYPNYATSKIPSTS